MRLRSSPVDLLLALPREAEREDQLASFRQALAALAGASGQLGPPPLDGADAAALEMACQVALERGLADEMDFLDPGSVALALYELSSACPAGAVRRDLRRRVFSFLYAGHAGTFLPVATRMALGAATPLESPTLKARVALCLDLPFGSEQNAAPLALALVTRSVTRPVWLEGPARGALFSRRLAAQLLEHAAREAVTRSELGDRQPLGLLLSSEIQSTWALLLADREPLVWRHAAVARGLLAAIHVPTRQDVEQALSLERTPTDWRRGLVSLTAAMILGDQEAHTSVHSVLSGPLPARDPGLPTVVPFGLGWVLEREPARAENVLERLEAQAAPAVVSAVAELLEKVEDTRFAGPLRSRLAAALRERSEVESPLERALSARTLRTLSGETDGTSDVPELVRHALHAFASVGAEHAHQLAQEAITRAHAVATALEAGDLADAAARGTALGHVHELDRGAFEQATLSELLLLGRKPGDTDAHVEPMERLQGRVRHWILAGMAPELARAWNEEFSAFDRERLKVLLHLLDTDRTSAADASSGSLSDLQESITALFERLEAGVDPSLHRVLCAALARSFDAAVREGAMQIGDLILVAAARLTEPEVVKTMAEASTSPDVGVPLAALAAFMAPETSAAREELFLSGSQVGSEEGPEPSRVVRRLTELSQGIVGGGGYHAEALRRVLFRLARALEAIAVARSRTELVDPGQEDAPVLDELELATHDLASMLRCAERRVLGGRLDRSSLDYGGPSLRTLIERGLSTDQAPTADQIGVAAEALVVGLPESIAHAVQQMALRISALPRSAKTSIVPLAFPERRAPLPHWLLPRRTIGSFYVVRPLGTGGVSSVFVVRRYDERNDPAAENLALKVPEYDPSTARSMSEQDFLHMFREEAGALLSLPTHPNLARFVTFDLGARPKPILVMELILGTALDRLLRSKSLTMARAAEYLDGILAGLEAMHDVGIGHLDVKPTNVILRDGRTPVLVDFGLSGRRLRPGCGTAEYTSPEVLGVAPEGYDPVPPAADMYSVGCLAYELFTGSLLFRAADELALVTAHVSHDGWLPELAAMNERPSLGRLARTIGACLRRDPRQRLGTREARERFAVALAPLADMPWPIDGTTPARVGSL